MYTSPAYPPTASPYHSPPSDPYRASPIAMAPKQPYSGAFSPPPMPPANAFSPMSSGQPQPGARYGNYAPGYSRPSTSSGFQAPYPNGAGQPQPAYVPQQPQQLPPARHKGTLAPGQMVQVGDQAVRIERYLSEGGYAHVYLTSSDRPIYPPVKGETKKGRWGEKGYTQHCLKRIAFEDESVWVDVRKEIEVMNSSLSYTPGGGIIDLLNKRLRDRLTEIEILNIFTDVCEAVAAMHAMSTPLLHRDLKIENVLSSPTSSGPTPQRPTPLTFKLCDFGSTTFPASHTPQSKIEADALAMDLNKHTTLQYRSPEMVEPMLGWAVGLPSDVWALGVLLYKLCYYTTPFEEHGTLAIVNAKYTFPQYPVYSPRLQHLIASMLVEQPQRRPSVFEILKTAHEMSGTRPEIDYPTPSRSITTSATQPPRISTTSTSKSSTNLLDFTSPTSPTDRTPVMQPSIASTVQPQRRGRPARETSRTQIPTLPQPPQPSQTTPSGHSSRPRPHPSDPSQVPNPQVKLQVTGDKASVPLANGARTDAFGMPPTTTQSAKTGFGDSFSTLRSPPTGSSGFGKSFGTLKSPPINPSTYGSSLQAQSSSFGDAFDRATIKPLSPKQTSKAPIDAFESSFAPKPTSPPRRSPDPSSSIPDGEVSFETRFPSLEALSSSDDLVLPPIQANPTPSAQLLSPDVGSSAKSRPSMLGNMTGGDLSAYAPSNPANRNRPPQPRSTHVTGTAFKTPSSGMLSSSPVQSRTEYFENVGAGASSGSSETPRPPQDLMTGDDEPIAALSLRPTLSTSASSTSAHGLAARTPGTQSQEVGSARPPFPRLGSNSSASNTSNGPQWSPIAEATEPPPADGDAQRLDSSDEEAGPEDASRHARPQTVRTGSQAQPLLEQDPSKSKNRSLIKPKAVSTPVPPTPTDIGVYRPANRRVLTQDRSRPQSMIVLPTNSSSSSLLSLPPADAGGVGGVPKSSVRPGHVRKGSITEMVERYENMQAPSSGASGASGVKKDSGPGPVRKPSVAAKPATLRKVTADDKASPSPVNGKPTSSSMVEPRTAQSQTEVKSPIPVKAKPEVAKKPGKFGDGQAPAGYSRSNSGRAFPVSKPSVAARPGPSQFAWDASALSVSAAAPNPVASAPGAQGAGSNESAEQRSPLPPSASTHASPEKQQSVNLLIQRWNQGRVGGKEADASAKRGGYI